MSDHNENDRRVRAAQGMQHKAQGVHAQEAGQIDMSAIPPAAVELGHIFADAGYELALVAVGRRFLGYGAQIRYPGCA